MYYWVWLVIYNNKIFTASLCTLDVVKNKTLIGGERGENFEAIYIIFNSKSCNTIYLWS